MNNTEVELHEVGIDLTVRLVSMADRLQQTAKELAELAERLRDGEGKS